MHVRRATPALLLAGAAVIAGCGSTTHASSATTTAAATATTAKSAPATGTAAEITVIRDWANTLRSGDIKGAAKYFATPSVFENGAAVVIHSTREAELVNESLSCGAQLTSAHKRGRFIIAEFKLVNRTGPGAGCGSGTGAPAAVDFIIAHDHIVDWIRAPANGGLPTVPTPTTQQNPGEV